MTPSKWTATSRSSTRSWQPCATSWRPWVTRSHLSAIATRDEAAERALGRALIQAQYAADRAADEAAQESERILEDAHRQRRDLLDHARQEHERLMDAARRDGNSIVEQARAEADRLLNQARSEPRATPAPLPWESTASPRVAGLASNGAGAADHSSDFRPPPVRRDAMTVQPPAARPATFSPEPPTGRPVIPFEGNGAAPPPKVPPTRCHRHRGPWGGINVDRAALLHGQLTPTAVFFHAHPDDETVFTGGTIRRLVATGHRAVIVTATSGGRGHDYSGGGLTGAALSERRADELQRAAAILGAECVMLGFADSGAGGAAPGGFAGIDPAVAAEVR